MVVIWGILEALFAVCEGGPCCPYEEHPVSDRISCNPDRLESPDTVSRPDYGRGGPPQTGPGYGGPTYRPDYGGGASPNWACVRRAYIQT